jgi:hypothetical protein
LSEQILLNVFEDLVETFEEFCSLNELVGPRSFIFFVEFEQSKGLNFIGIDQALLVAFNCLDNCQVVL